MIKKGKDFNKISSRLAGCDGIIVDKISATEWLAADQAVYGRSISTFTWDEATTYDATTTYTNTTA